MWNTIPLRHKVPLDNPPGAVNTLALDQDEYLEDPDEYVLELDNSANNSSNGSYPKKLFARLVIDNSIINFHLNCGATVNIMPCDLYVDVVGDKKIRLLKQTATKLPMFNQTELQTLRATTLLTQNPKNRKHYEIKFVMVNKGLKPLLGAPSIQILNVMFFKKNCISK